MAWQKEGNNKWTLYIDGEVAGYIVLTKYKNGTLSYSGIAMNKKTRAVSKSFVSAKLTPVKNAVARAAVAQRKK